MADLCGRVSSNEGEEQDEFREMIAQVGDLRAAGGLRGAGRILEEVWKKRKMGVMETEVWDVTACFNILGAPALLV